MVDIGKAIRSGLEKKKMSNMKLAEIMKVGPSSVSMWLANKATPPGDKLIKIANILDIVPQLFPNTEIKDPNEATKISETRKMVWGLDSKVKSIEEKINFRSLSADHPLQVLIVEDDIRSYLTIQEALVNLQVPYPVIHAESTEKALRILKESSRKTSLIILDIVMNTGMSGIDFLEHISGKHELNSIPIVLVTGALEDVITKAMQYDGIFGLVRKPFDFVKFTNILRKLDLTWPIANIKRQY